MLNIETKLKYNKYICNLNYVKKLGKLIKYKLFIINYSI